MIDRNIDIAARIWTLPIIEIIRIGIIIGKAKMASKVALFEIILKLEHRQEIKEIAIDEMAKSRVFCII